MSALCGLHGLRSFHLKLALLGKRGDNAIAAIQAIRSGGGLDASTSQLPSKNEVGWNAASYLAQRHAHLELATNKLLLVTIIPGPSRARVGRVPQPLERARSLSSPPQPYHRHCGCQASSEP